MSGIRSKVSALVALVVFVSSLQVGAVQPASTTWSAPAQVDPPDSLTRPLDSSFPDSIVHPAAPAAVAAFQSSLALDGLGDYVSVPNSDALNPVDQLTIEAWVRRTSIGCQTVVGKNYHSSYWLGFCSDKLRFYSGGGSLQDGNTDIPANLWTHVAVVWTLGGQEQFYINGELDKNVAAGPAPTGNDPLYIGADIGDAPILYEFAGNIAEVRIWKIARSQDDIRRTMHIALNEPRPGLSAVWHLTDDYNDSIGGNHGTQQGDADLSGPQAPPQPALVPIDQYFSSLPQTREAAGAAYLPSTNRALIVGGWVGGSVSGAVDAVDAASGYLTSIGSLPGGAVRAYPAVAYAPISDTVYVFGGYDGVATYYQTIYAIDPGTGAARTLAATLPAPMAPGAAVYHARLGKIYIFGGADGSNPRSDVYAFDPATETLTPLTITLPSGRYSFASAYSAATDKIYAFGGQSTGSVTTTLEIVLQPDGLTGAVNTVPTAPLPYYNSEFSAVEDPVSHLIYLIGGSNADNVIAFDPVTTQMWETLTRLPERRGRPAVVYDSRNRQAVLMGGTNGPAKSDVWRIPLGDGPQLAMGRWDFAQPVSSTVQAINGSGRRVAVGTYSSGLYRYNDDGTRNQWDSGALGSGNVNDVRYNAATDHLWAATNSAGGKLIDSSGTITTYGISELGTNVVQSVDTEPGYTVNGEPFFGTDTNGLRWQSYVQFPLPAHYDWRSDFPGQIIRTITHRADKEVWAIAGGQLVSMTYYFDPGSFLTVVSTATFPSAVCNLYQPTDIAADRNGDLWVVSPNVVVLSAARKVNRPTGPLVLGQGVCQIKSPAGGMVTTLQTPLVGAAASRVDVDSEGRVWVSVKSQSSSGETGGLVTYQNLSGTLRTAETNWITGPVGSLITMMTGWDSGFTAVGAADERVWAGKSDGRLVTIAPRWQQLDEVSNLRQQSVWGVWAARGRLFAATVSGTVNYLYVLAPDGKTWDVRNMGTTSVDAVMSDSQGRIWVGTSEGVRWYTPTGWDTLAGVEGNHPTYVSALAEDREGRIWIGSQGGLTLFDHNRFVATFTRSNSSLPDNYVHALLTDKRGQLWIGTVDKLAVLNMTSWTVYSTTHGLPSNDVYDLAQAGDGRLAVSTYDGLAFFNDATSTFYAEDVPGFVPFTPLTVDDQGRLWAGGAVRNSGGWQAYYSTNSGLVASRVVDNAADRAGYVWFGHGSSAGGLSVRGTYLPPLGTVLPSIDSISSSSGSAGTVITITGSGFSANPAEINVVIGGAPVDLLSASTTQLVVRIGEETISGDVSVNVRGRRVTYTGSGGNRAFCAVPVITRYDPTGGNNGVPVTIHGTNFDPDGVQVILGGGAERRPFFSSPTELRVYIQSADVAGDVIVLNHAPRCSIYTANAAGFRHYNLSIATIALNQGLTTYPLMANRPTLVSSFLTTSPAQWGRATDRFQVDTIQVIFTDAANHSITHTVPHSLTVPAYPSMPAALLADIVNAVNAENLSLGVPGFAQGTLTTRVVLWRSRQLVTQGSRTDNLEPNRLMRVILVPIMANFYTYSDLLAMQERVEDGLDNLRRRIMPTGQVEFIWSPEVMTRDYTFSLGNYYRLYDASHSMDRIRRQWNDRNPNQAALIAFGVVDPRLVEGTTSGLGFWPDVSEIANLLLANFLDTLCDIGNALLQVFSFGLLGSDDGCHLEIPLYVGWAKGENRASELFGHEFGHIMGLVGPTAPNGDLWDNLSHSINDELEGGYCGEEGVTYSVGKTLYRQPGVYDPVVNPISGQQFRPQLSVDENGVTASQWTNRGKAIMSYACTVTNTNVFYEPVDVGSVRAMYGASSFLNFFHDLRPTTVSRASASQDPVGAKLTATDVPTPTHVAGPRLYISGVVSKTVAAGSFMNVEALGDDAPLSAGFATGYWVVQRNITGTELSRVGVFPLFNTTAFAQHPADNSSAPTVAMADTGFFAATVLRASGVVTIELRKNNTVLDSFVAGSAVPTITLTSPSGGVYSSGVITVSWLVTDTDGDPVSVAIDYSRDGTNWQPVGFSTGNSITVPVFLLGGSSNAQIRVTASDGLNRASVTSAPFTVSNQPPHPFISQPTAGAVAWEGQRLTLVGGANDNQDRRVADANLHWDSSRDGSLGTGSNLGVLLSVGAHTLTLQATNSVGLTATTSVTLTVQGDYDADGISDNDELASRLNPLTESDAFSDADGDGLPLVMERRRGTDPNNPDSDGDGVPDDVEIAAGTDPRNSADNPGTLPPDRLSVRPNTLVFTADLSLDTPLPQHAVQVTSRAPTSWTLASNVDWLGSSAITGTTVAAPTILVDTYRLDDGLHTGVLTFTSAALTSTVTVPITVTISNKSNYCDANRDGATNSDDIQAVSARVGTDNTQPGFDYHYDIDRNGRIDATDVQWINQCVFGRGVYLPVILR